MESDNLVARLSELARTAAPPASLDSVLEAVTASVVDILPAADSAGILLISPGGVFESRACTSEVPRRLDQYQEEFGEGPCLEAAIDELVVRADDFRTDGRWPRYGPAAVEAGVLSGLSFKLYTSRRKAGALNIFAKHANAFDAQAEAIGSALAAHAAAAIVASRNEEQLKSALMTRDIIGQAKGMIMERYKSDAVRAFELLRQLSQDTNTPLVEIAQQIVSAESPG
jgi:GAF domain-containing protein